MFRAQICAVMGMVLMLASTSTDAAELSLFVENRLGGTDNATQRSQVSAGGRRSDGFWELAPRLTLRENQTKELLYDFRYQPSLEKYFENPELDGWDQNARGNLDWRVTPTQTLGVNGFYANTRQVGEEFLDVGIVVPDPPLEPGIRQRLSRGRANAYYSKNLTQALSGRLDYRFDDLDFSRRDVSDSRAHSGSAGLTLALDPLTSVGLTGSLRYRDSKINQTNTAGQVLAEIRSTSRTIDLSFSLQRQLTKTIAVTAQAGPSWIDTEQDVAPPGGVSTKSRSNDLSWFAAISGRKEFRKGDLSLAYTRFETGGGNTVNSQIVDDVSVEASYRFDRDWDVRLVGGWNRREQIADDLSTNNNDKFTRYQVIGAVTRAITPRIDIQGRVNYRIQIQDRPGEDPRTETLIGWIALRYTFDPIVF